MVVEPDPDETGAGAGATWVATGRGAGAATGACLTAAAGAGFGLVATGFVVVVLRLGAAATRGAAARVVCAGACGRGVADGDAVGDGRGEVVRSGSSVGRVAVAGCAVARRTGSAAFVDWIPA